jgi:hypothetical protein
MKSMPGGYFYLANIIKDNVLSELDNQSTPFCLNDLFKLMILVVAIDCILVKAYKGM